jgi:hypothetical protein
MLEKMKAISVLALSLLSVAFSASAEAIPALDQGMGVLRA